MEDGLTIGGERAPGTRRSFLALGAAALSAGCQTSWPSGGDRAPTTTVECDTSGGWTQFQADAANTGVCGRRAPSMDANSTELAEVTERSGGVVADGGGRVFVVDQQDVWALDAAEASESWRRSFDSLVATTPLLLCDALVVQTSIKTCALDSATGETLWEASPGNQFADPVSDGRHAYIAAGVPTALDLRDGSTMWTHELSGVSPWGCCLADETVVVAGERDDGGALVGLDAASGERQWRTDFGNPVKTSPTDDDGTVYVPDMWGDVYAVTAATGTVEWQTAVYEQLPSGRRSPTPTVVDGTVVVPSGNARRSVGLNAASGTEEWQLKTGPTLAPALCTESGIVMGTMNEGLFLVGESGSVSDNRADTRVASQMALTDDGLFFKAYGRELSLSHLPV
ncbi:PQQ-binding-like beta-propeller repeat protein [Halosimplex sp. TS25]|uniref:PQQ-binding-like beta-propeller repeat protein n=1 Tax=Halosimplex rarum TaxID=3396619 RepID=UPI0039EBCB0F